MGEAQKALVRAVLGGILVLGLQGLLLPVAAQQVPEQSSGRSEATTQRNPTTTARVSVELPDSPGVLFSESSDSFQPGRIGSGQTFEAISTVPQSSQTEIAQNQSPQTQTPATETQPSPQQKPVGTAAAEAPNASGIAASQPAGIAMAPAKQRRVRTIVLRVGAIAAAGVAVGSVVALTAGTSSKPPGAH